MANRAACCSLFVIVFTTRYSLLAIRYSLLLQHEVERQDLVVGHRRMLDAARRGLPVAAHRVEAIADRSDRHPMARARHRRQYQPTIERRVEGFDCPKRREQALILAFATGDDDVAVIDAGA